MKNKLMRAMCVCASCLMLVSLVGCSGQSGSVDLMKDVKGNAGEVAQNDVGSFDGIQYRFENGALAITDFGVELMKKCYDGQENMLISPLSVISALAMTANGAQGETLGQILEIFGITRENLNEYLRDYQADLPQGKKYQLNMANAIWFKDVDTFTVNQEFLQTNQDFFRAGVYSAPFDETTRRDINNWVERNTNGMIKEVLDKISDEAVMYLVNALAFEAEWKEVYKENRIRERDFTKEDGTVVRAEFMYSEEEFYLEDEDAIGLMKYYADESYAFVALMPKEGMTVKEYIETLAGEELNQLLCKPQKALVNAAIPKFKTEYSAELKNMLQPMGMTDAFDGALADFTGLGNSTDGNIYINRVIHKTFIEVDEKGTKAGAATVVEMKAAGAIEMPEPKNVILDRPFVYMIIDCKEKVPVFIGTMMDVSK